MKQHSTSRAVRRGMAHLLCLFVMVLVSVMTIAMVNGSVSRWAGVRNAHEYDRAYYLAAAGVHQAIYELEQDTGWRGPITAAAYPVGSSDTMAATVVEEVDGTLTITGVGVAGSVTRKLSVNVSLGG
jgi:hypothetical protein